MTTQPGKQVIAVHILSNISKSKGDETKKCGQLIEYNMKKHFSSKTMHKIWWKNYPQTPLLRNWNWAYLWINSLKFFKVCFNCMPSWRLSKYIEGKLQTLCFWLIESFLRKTKAGLELVFLPNFLHDFSRKVFPLLYLLTV